MHSAGTVTISLAEWNIIQQQLASNRHTINILQSDLEDRETFLSKHVMNVSKYAKHKVWKDESRFATIFDISAEMPTVRLLINDSALFDIRCEEDAVQLALNLSEDMIRKWARQMAYNLVNAKVNSKEPRFSI